MSDSDLSVCTTLASLIQGVKNYVAMNPDLSMQLVEMSIAKSNSEVKPTIIVAQDASCPNKEKNTSFVNVDMIAAMKKITEVLESYPTQNTEQNNTESKVELGDLTFKNKTQYESNFVPDYPFSISTAQYPTERVYNPPDGSIQTQKLLKAISRAQYDFMKDTSVHELFSHLLKSLLIATDSEYGFIGRICFDEKKQAKYLRTYAFCDTSWSDETKAYYATHLKDGLVFRSVDTLIGYSIRTGKFCISNDPSSDPRSGGIPYGHPPLRYYLGCPLSTPKPKQYKDHKPQLIGLVGIANRDGGYNKDMITALLPLLHTCAGIIDRYEVSEENDKLQSQLKQTNQELEKRIAARTLQLEQKNIVLLQEIEQRKEIEEALATAMDFKNEFFSTMSHELRCPIQAIVGIADLLVDSTLTPTQKKYIQIIQQNGANMTQLVNDVLDIGKLDAGKMQFTNDYFSVVECLNEVASTYSLGAFSKGIEFGIQYDPLLFQYELLSDVGRVKQIIVNLVSNAIKFTSHGFVRIQSKFTLQTEDRAILQINICDSGVGISEAQIQNLFQIFYQVTGESTRDFTGTGIGLFLCKKLLASMDGHIQVSSKIGEGSTFSIDFPVPCRPTDNYKTMAVFFKKPLKKGLHHQIAIIDPCSFTRNSLAIVLKTITQLPDDRIQEFDENSADKLFTESTFKSFVKQYTVIFIDKYFEDKYSNYFTSSDTALQAMLLAKVVFIRRISSTVDTSTLNENYFNILRPIVVDELIKLLRVVLKMAKPKIIKQRANRCHSYPILSKGSRILIVDDSKLNRTILKKLAENIGFVAYTAESGESALQLQKNSRDAPYDLVLMDMCMDGMDGLECCRQWRQYELENNLLCTFIVAATGNSSPEDVELCLSAGMNHHLSKPITKAKLASFLRNE